jgi:23S rRNA pseudouridine1911/1915/1917 synthase
VNELDNSRFASHLLSVAKPREIELPDGTRIPILYEDRSVLALDKPAGWLMVPTSWEKTGRNLQLALESSINAGDFWAKSRNLKFLRFVHRLDADTSGVVLFVKSPGAMRAYSELFESRALDKGYLAVVEGVPAKAEWTSTLAVAPVPGAKSKMQAVTSKRPPPETKEAETHFRILKSSNESTLLLARPKTGRTHQIRVHLAAAGHPVSGDVLYGNIKAGRSVPADPPSRWGEPLALRAIALAYRDPFTRKHVRIEAPFGDFVRIYGFTLDRNELWDHSERQKNV